MNNTIKAIQTHYKGYHFRSRLEARYAVLFDWMGHKWQYETEGFELPEGRYLPDFWLPEYGLYVEVKGQAPSQHSLDLCVSLARVTYCNVLLCVGELIQEDDIDRSPHHLFVYHRLAPFFAKILTENPESAGNTQEDAAAMLKQGGFIQSFRNAPLFSVCGELGFDVRQAEKYRDVMRSARFEFTGSAN